MSILDLFTLSINKKVLTIVTSFHYQISIEFYIILMANMNKFGYQ